MGFWNRLIGTSGAERIVDARAAGRAVPRHWYANERHGDLCCDPRVAAQALHLATSDAAELGFVPRREITVDDVDFDFYNGPEGFRLEHLSALLRLTEDDGSPLFPHTVHFDPECVNSNDAYSRLLWQVAEAAGTEDRFSQVHCDLHFGPLFDRHPVGELSYVVEDRPVKLEIAVEGEWADPEVVRQIFQDATPEGHRWVATGDYAVHVWVPEERAEDIARIFATEDTAAEARLAGILYAERHHGPRRPHPHQPGAVHDEPEEEEAAGQGQEGDGDGPRVAPDRP